LTPLYIEREPFDEEIIALQKLDKVAKKEEEEEEEQATAYYSGRSRTVGLWFMWIFFYISGAFVVMGLLFLFLSLTQHFMYGNTLMTDQGLTFLIVSSCITLLSAAIGGMGLFIHHRKRQ
jgi:hypothetical protein